MRRPPQPPLPTLFERAAASLERGPVAPPAAASAAPIVEAVRVPAPDPPPDPPPVPDPPPIVPDPEPVPAFTLAPEPFDEGGPVDDENPFGLTLLEEAFVTAYLGVAFGNATKAYAVAGYSTVGLGATVRNNAANLLKKPQVRRAVTARRRELRALLNGAMEREEALRRMSVIARGDPREVWAHEPQIRDLPAHVAACIKGVVRTEQGLRIDLCDRVHALEVLGKWRGLAHDRLDVTLTHRLEDILAESRRLPVVEAVAS